VKKAYFLYFAIFIFSSLYSNPLSLKFIAAQKCIAEENLREKAPKVLPIELNGYVCNLAEIKKIPLDKKNPHPLFITARQGKKEFVEDLLSIPLVIERSGNFISRFFGYTTKEIKPMYIDVKNCDGMTPLMCASENGHLLMVEELIQRGANVNEVSNHDINRDAFNALMYAIKSDHLLVVKELIRADTDLNMLVPSCLGVNTALEYATSIVEDWTEISTEIIKELLNTGAQLIIQNEDHSGLFNAVRNDHPEVVKLLLAKLAHVADHLRIDILNEALIEAIRNGNRVIIKLLITAGAQVDGISLIPILFIWSLNMTPLIVAVEEENLDLVKELINAGATVNLQTPIQGICALAVASISDSSLPVVKELISSGAQINLADISGITPLMGAAMGGNLSIVQFLIEQGVLINQQDNDGKTALFFAVLNQNVAIIKELLRNGAQINITNNNGENIFLAFMKHLFLCGNCYYQESRINTMKEIAMLLKQAGADIDAIDPNDDYSSLMYSVKNNQPELTKILIDAGANINLKNRHGKSALLLAIENENITIINMLIGAGATVDKEVMKSLAYNGLLSKKLLGILSIGVGSWFAYKWIKS